LFSGSLVRQSILFIAKEVIEPIVYFSAWLPEKPALLADVGYTLDIFVRRRVQIDRR